MEGAIEQRRNQLPCRDRLLPRFEGRGHVSWKGQAPRQRARGKEADLVDFGGVVYADSGVERSGVIVDVQGAFFSVFAVRIFVQPDSEKTDDLNADARSSNTSLCAVTTGCYPNRRNHPEHPTSPSMDPGRGAPAALERLSRQERSHTVSHRSSARSHKTNSDRAERQ